MKKILIAFLLCFSALFADSQTWIRSTAPVVDSNIKAKAFMLPLDTIAKGEGRIGVVNGTAYLFHNFGYTSLSSGTNLNGTGYVKMSGISVSYVNTPIPVSDGGTNATSAGLTAFNNITGYMAAGTTGSTSSSLVFSAAPSLAQNLTLLGNNSSTGNIFDLSSPAANISSNIQANSVTSATAGTIYSGLALIDTTAASNGNQMYSPALYFLGKGWASTGGTSQTDRFRIYEVPLQGTTNSTANLTIEGSVNGGSYSNSWTFATGGTFTCPAAINVLSGNIQVTDATIATTSTDGVMIRNNTAATSGVPVQYSSRFRWTGTAWNTGGTPATNTDDFIAELQPVSGNPTSANLVFSSQLNAGGYTKQVSFSSGGNVTLNNGNLVLNTAGNKISITTGSNASAGVSGAMSSGTITISTTAVTSSSLIFLTGVSTGAPPCATCGSLSVGTITNGTSFVINSSLSTDTRAVNWWIIN